MLTIVLQEARGIKGRLETREIRGLLRANRQARPRRWPGSLSDLAARYGCHRSLMTKALADPRRYPDARRFIERSVKVGTESALSAPLGALPESVRRQMSAMDERQLDAIIVDPPFGSPFSVGTLPTAVSEQIKEYSPRKSSQRRGVAVRRKASDAFGGTGTFLTSASGAEPPSSERRTLTGAENMGITMHFGSGKTAAFAWMMSLVHDPAKLNVSRKIPVRISITPEIEIAITAHLSQELADTLFKLIRDYSKAVVLGIPVSSQDAQLGIRRQNVRATRSSAMTSKDRGRARRPR
jgi:hypothetical protein